MATNFVQEGNVLNHTAASNISSGDVVVLGGTTNAIIGIAMADIASGATGPVAVSGVFTVPKVSAAVFTQGEGLIWDSSASAFDDNAATPASGDVSNSAVAAADGANTETTCQILLTGTPGTLTA